MPVWGNIKDEKIEVINNMQEFSNKTGISMPDVDISWRLELLHEEFDKMKEKFWNK